MPTPKVTWISQGLSQLFFPLDAAHPSREYWVQNSAYPEQHLLTQSPYCTATTMLWIKRSGHLWQARCFLAPRDRQPTSERFKKKKKKRCRGSNFLRKPWGGPGPSGRTSPLKTSAEWQVRPALQRSQPTIWPGPWALGTVRHANVKH